jgi:tetratricopeptide (TPR) repeat protein/ribosomal protein L40E
MREEAEMTYRSPYYQRLYNEGIMYLNSGRYDAALAAFNQARDLWDNSYAYSGMGRAYYGLERYQEALINFEKAYCMYSPNIQAAHWRAKALGKLKRYKEAEMQFEAVLRLLGNGPVNFYQEVSTDFEEMRGERDGRRFDRSFMQSPMSDALSKNTQPQIIVQGNNGPVNIGGILATDDAILNRPGIKSEPDTGRTVPIDQTIEKPEERDPGNTKPAGIISRIFKKETCVKCGASIQKDQIYCNKCGRKLQ